MNPILNLNLTQLPNPTLTFTPTHSHKRTQTPEWEYFLNFLETTGVDMSSFCFRYFRRIFRSARCSLGSGKQLQVVFWVHDWVRFGWGRPGVVIQLRFPPLESLGWRCVRVRVRNRPEARQRWVPEVRVSVSASMPVCQCQGQGHSQGQGQIEGGVCCGRQLSIRSIILRLDFSCFLYLVSGFS